MPIKNISIRFFERCAIAGLLLALVAGCAVNPYPPPYAGSSSDGYYSYPEYPSAYSNYGYPAYRNDNYSSAYSGNYDEFNATRDANERNGLGNSDDRNFHNRDDYQQYDR
jgi:hypothetical protein